MERLLRWGAAASSAAVVVLLLLPSTTVGASPNSTTWVAPYQGKVAAGNSTYVQGCANASSVGLPHFQLKSGHGGWSLRSTAGSCGGPGGLGSEAASIQINIPIRFVANGPHRVTENLTVLAVVHQSIVSGLCASRSLNYSYCAVGANESAYVYIVLMDTTNGTSFYASSSWYTYNFSANYSSCYQRTCSGYRVSHTYGSFGGQSMTIQGTFKSGHRYLLVTYAHGYVVSFINTYKASLKGANASSRLDMSPPSYGVSLSSITIL